MKRELSNRQQQLKKAEERRKAPVRYRTRAQMEEEKEELAVADELTSLQTIQELTNLLRSWQMKEFYKKANALLKIKRSNPVVTKVMREDELGEAQVFEEKSSVHNPHNSECERVNK